MLRLTCCPPPPQGSADPADLEALIINSNTARKLVWRAKIARATADGNGTVWLWHLRDHAGREDVDTHGLAPAAPVSQEDVASLKPDKTGPSPVPRLPMKTRLKTCMPDRFKILDVTWWAQGRECSKYFCLWTTCCDLRTPSLFTSWWDRIIDFTAGEYFWRRPRLDNVSRIAPNGNKERSAPRSGEMSRFNLDYPHT